MNIQFERSKHEALISDYEALSRKYNRPGAPGPDNADEILDTINALHAANSLFDVPRIYHPHPLQGNRKGSFAVWVTKKDRMIFKPNYTDNPETQIDNFKTITSIVITDIFENYHKK